MILKGSQRGNARELSKHLMNVRDNEHVELHDLRGFMSEEDLHEALAEAEAISKGTRCKQHLFSLSLNPPEGVHVDTQTFETAIEMAEQKLGLDGQPRAVVFHEKEGRRHAHAVWSRIDTDSMTAKQMSFTKVKLMDVSRELYLRHGWEMPKGMVDRENRNPLTFSRAEWQQAARAKLDPRMVKAMFKDTWERSDSAESLKSALEQRGYYLAQGDRRGVVAVDYRGEAFSLSRWVGVKAKDVNARFANATELPKVDEQRQHVAALMADGLRRQRAEIEEGYKRARPSIEFRRTQMVERHRIERTGMAELQKQRETREAAARASLLPNKGVGKWWSQLTGRYSKLIAQNEHDAWQALKRDQVERDKMISRQLDERQRLQQAIRAMREERIKELMALRQEIANYMLMKQGKVPKIEPKYPTTRADARSEETKRTERRRADDRQRERQCQRPRDRGLDRGREF
ncbi:relaxase/mobilization nuclease domain-containing protein [Leisingera sp. NJS204]|uniref:relaxase/mobilization nuclease domain-containing protein n=1 Tax=Leisingera sp. NJS204 TaxID=2508307 RepID=UPI0013E96473|nr:relaxase/mobilization nuclease domain-containing protein [Leisingera sp. NJS204]